jgi:hypothetical protein
MAGEKARLREKLFNDYSARYAAVGGEPDKFMCPICKYVFDRDAIEGDNPKLTLAHVLPEALGGNYCSLACAKCNNDMGSDLESFLIERFKAEDAMNGVGTLPGRMKGEFGSVGVEFQTAPLGEPWRVLVVDKQTNPTVLKKMNAALEANPSDNTSTIVAEITPRWLDKPSRVTAALYQSGYLLMFAYFGYEVVNDPRYARLREQIIKPDEEILPPVFSMPPMKWAEKELPESHGIMIVKEPSPYIMPVFRFRPNGGLERVIGIRLPGLDDETWPARGQARTVNGVIVRFRPAKDDGVRPTLRGFWEQAKRMT